MIADPQPTQQVDSRPAAGYPGVTRLDSLDLLRGLCALAVAVFHYHSWGGLYVPAAFNGFLAVCGTYGVSVFFVLSGFSLAHAYGPRFDGTVSVDGLSSYMRRRVGRLLPLFAVITLASAAGKVLTGNELPDVYTLAANLTLVFGFADPTQTPVIGGWSIGIEVVFYVLFPVLLLLRRHWLAVLAVAIFLTAWTSIRLGALPALDQGWALYVAPANNLIFFAAGAYAGLNSRHRTPWPPGYGALCIMALLVLIAAASYGATELSVVTGIRRLILVPAAILLVVAAARVQLNRLSFVASLSGGISYPLYLVHPLIFFLSARILPVHSWFFALLLVAAIVIAVATDHLIDKPVQRRIKAAGW